MNLLFLGPNLGPGGAERQSSILLPGLRRRGYDARLVALDGGGPFANVLADAGVPLEILHMRSQIDVLPLMRSTILRKFKPDVVVSRGVNGMYVGQALAFLRGARHIFNDHRQVGLPLSRRREAMAKLLTPRLDQVIAVTPGQSGAWRRRGLPQTRFAVIPNGVEIPGQSRNRNQIRRELGISPSAVVAVAVCSLRPEKRIGDFADAIIRVSDRQRDLVGLVVGDGPDRPLLARAQSEREGSLIATGERIDAPQILAACDVFVSTSEREALPMAILEAMAAGLPVIATTVGGVPQMVEGGRSGLLIPPRVPQELDAALERLVVDPGFRDRLGHRGRELHRARWSAGRMIDSYAELLGRIVVDAQMNHGHE